MVICSLRGIMSNVGELSDTNMATPFAVSIVTASCQRPLNLVRIVDLRHRSIAHHRDIGHTVNFSVCVPPIISIFDEVSDVVEFIEVNRMFGAEKFQFYVDSVSPRVASCLLEYARRSVVEVQPWTVPMKIAPFIYQHGQILAINECLYRLMYRTKYVVVQYVDQFTVPMRSDSWLSMLDNVNKDTGRESNRIASYNFRNRFFPAKIPKLFDFTWQNEVQRRFKTLTAVQAEEESLSFIDRSRVMARPERVIMWHGNNNNLVHSEDVNARVNVVHGQLFQYTSGTTVANTTILSRMLEFEQLLLRRLYVATAAICLTGDYQFS